MANAGPNTNGSQVSEIEIQFEMISILFFNEDTDYIIFPFRSIYFVSSFFVLLKLLGWTKNMLVSI
jgi:hypothetical protein